MVKRTVPKTVKLPVGRRFVSLYRRVTRNELPANVKI